MTDHKHPTAAFWITVALVVVLVGYPLSFGAACWLTRARDGILLGPAIYLPLGWTIVSRLTR